MNKKKPKIRKKTKFVFNYRIDEIKKQNLFFAVTYCETGSVETYTDILRWSEIEKPKTKDIEVLKMLVLKNERKVLTINQKNSKKLLNILDMYNNTGLLYNEIEPATAPAEKDIVFCISLYFGIAPKFSRSDILFKMYLREIAEKRKYFDSINNPKEKEVFKTYLYQSISKVETSKLLTNHTKTGVYLIDKNLRGLVTEIMKDYENGLLHVVEYQKPLTKREVIKKVNENLQQMGIDTKIPLRKKSDKEHLNDWEKFKNKLESKK